MTDIGMLFIGLGILLGGMALGSGIEDGLTAIADALKEEDDDT